MKQVLLIVGMHRSGTSAVAGAVAGLGLPLGERILPGQARDNPKGFFEHADVVAAHDRLLAGAGLTWDDPGLWIAQRPELPGAESFAERLRDLLDRECGPGPPWCVKDPRLCRLLPLWEEPLRAARIEPLVLLVHRDPAAVAASLARRDAFSAEKAALLWLDHVLGAERWSRELRRTVVSYDELLRDPVEVLERLGESLSLEWPLAPADRRAELEDFLGGKSPGTAHPPAAGAAPSLAADVWRQLATAHPGLPEEAALDALAERVAEEAHRVDALLLGHLGQVLERTVELRLWERAAPIEERLAETRRVLHETAEGLQGRLAGLESGLARVAELAEGLRDDLSGERGASLRDLTRQFPEVCAELRHQGEVIETTRTELGALGAEVRSVAGQLDASARQLHATAGTQQEALSWLAARLDELERRSAPLLVRLRSWWASRRGG